MFEIRIVILLIVIVAGFFYLGYIFYTKSATKKQVEKESEASKKFRYECERFRKMYDAMSQEDKNKIAGIENPRTPEEEDSLERERVIISEHLKVKGSSRKKSLETEEDQYYLYKDRFLACGREFGHYEWYIAGEWVKDESLTIRLCDSMLGYDDASPCDYDQISKEEAMQWIAETEKQDASTNQKLKQ